MIFMFFHGQHTHSRVRVVGILGRKCQIKSPAKKSGREPEKGRERMRNNFLITYLKNLSLNISKIKTKYRFF